MCDDHATVGVFSGELFMADFTNSLHLGVHLFRDHNLVSI